MQIHTRFHEPRATREHTHHDSQSFVYRAITVYGPAFQQAQLPQQSTAYPLRQVEKCVPTTPHMQRPQALTHTRFSHHPLSLATTHRISLPTGTKMFHFPAFPPHTLYIQVQVTHTKWAGFPHSDTLGSQLVCQLPEAYRRLPRPSSAPSAKASTERPYKLTKSHKPKMLTSTIQLPTNHPHTTEHQTVNHSARQRAINPRPQ